MKIRAVKVSSETWRQLSQLKLDLGYKSMDELIGKMILVFNDAFQVKKWENKKK